MQQKAIHDISVMLGTKNIDYPGDQPYTHEEMCAIDTGADFNLSRLTLSVHAGTHIDFPAHFIPDGETCDSFPVSAFIRRAHVVQVHDAIAVRADELRGISTAPGDALLFKTDNSASGRCESGVYTEKYIYLAEDAAELCVERQLGLVGVDYVSVDKHGDSQFPAHHMLLGNGILILESITLAAVPEGCYTLLCLPLKIAGGEASPVRAVLLENESDS